MNPFDIGLIYWLNWSGLFNETVSNTNQISSPLINETVLNYVRGEKHAIRNQMVKLMKHFSPQGLHFYITHLKRKN